ncbi:MAG TPA: NlpC/P60 family protein [Actinomycetota bacterium]|nr:NlpC/P60 family protein [Actinomycetota bacterium]
MVAAVLALSVVGTANVSAAPSEEDVEAAQAKVEALGHELEVQIEKWNDAKYELQKAQQLLNETKRTLAAAEADADTARTALETRAVEAYTGMGSQISSVLEADDLSEFSDRLQFMGAIAQSDADLAAVAEAAGQRAEWARDRHEDAVAKAEEHVAAMEAAREEIARKLEEQERLATNLNQEYHDWLAAQRAALEAAQEVSVDAPPPSTGGGGDTGGDTGGSWAPPPNASGAQVAISAARSVVGTQYVWGAASPGSGFDCSGLTSWAWAQAGVYLPHSASAQWGSLPRVSLSAIQPGDIVYYGNFGPHVALYIGGGQIIHARHPGPGGEVQYDSLYGYDRPYGAVRPS